MRSFHVHHRAGAVVREPELEERVHGVWQFEGFPKLGVPFRGPKNKDYSILGSILGSPYFGKLPFRNYL